MIIALLTTAGLIFLAGTVVTIYAVRRAPEGYEDESGFYAVGEIDAVSAKRTNSVGATSNSFPPDLVPLRFERHNIRSGMNAPEYALRASAVSLK